MCAVVVGVPERFPLASFEPVQGVLTCVLAAPGSVGVLYFTLTAPLQPGVGAGLFYSLPPYEAVEFLAVVANECPSQIVSTGFATNAAVQACAECRLVVRMDALESFRELYSLTRGRTNHLGLARKIAQNLYDYLRSFEQRELAGVPTALIPLRAFDEWLQRVERRSSTDPCFFDK